MKSYFTISLLSLIALSSTAIEGAERQGRQERPLSARTLADRAPRNENQATLGDRLERTIPMHGERELPLSRRTAGARHVMPGQALSKRCVDQGHAHVMPGQALSMPCVDQGYANIGFRLDRPMPVRSCRVIREIALPRPCFQKVVFIEEDPYYFRPYPAPHVYNTGYEITFRKGWRY